MLYLQLRTLLVSLCLFVSITTLFAQEDELFYTMNVSLDSIPEYKSLALEFSDKSQPKEAVVYIKKYIGATGEMSFLNDYLFSTIKNSKEYLELKEKYLPKIGLLEVFYFSMGLLGVFSFVFFNLKKGKYRVNNFIISLFVLFHSVFILHLVLHITNIQYYLPHALFLSTIFSLLYGPLLFFYIKRIRYNYKFKWVDMLHLLPAVILFVFIFPYLNMSRLEKFNYLFNQIVVFSYWDYLIIVFKILSFILYSYLSIRVYKDNRGGLNNPINKNKSLWERNLIFLFLVYTLSYTIYASILVLDNDSLILYNFRFHLQLIIMISIVFYIAYISFMHPEIFMGQVKLVNPPNNFLKYKNSGLTPSYSLELKDNLLKSLNEDKIYKDGNLSLERLSEELGITKHNLSQIVNEHFEMSFPELMNKYRIQEAVYIFDNDDYNRLKIIQVAYDVGYNNKASFNKAFKKYMFQTPSQYIESLHG